MPHDEMVRFAIDKKLMDVEYLALSDQISTNAECPTVFDVIENVEVEEGEPVFNMMQWDTENAGVSRRCDTWEWQPGTSRIQSFKAPSKLSITATFQ